MKCPDCHSVMRKVDRRTELDELDEDATEGQFADHIAAQESGDHGAWNIGIVEYECPKCGHVIQSVSDELENFYPLIINWHEKAREGDSFARFVFQYLAFIAHIKNNLYMDQISDRKIIQSLKGDQSKRRSYLDKIASDIALSQSWIGVLEELRESPLHNATLDFDDPQIDRWWNSDTFQPNEDHQNPVGVIHDLENWPNMVEFWYGVRNNLFHGGKNPNIRRDIFLVEHAYFTLRAFMDLELGLRQ